MKKRLYGLAAMMLAVIIVVLAFPVQAKAESYYDLHSISSGVRVAAGDVVWVTRSGNNYLYIDNVCVVDGASGGFTYTVDKDLVFKGYTSEAGFDYDTCKYYLASESVAGTKKTKKPIIEATVPKKSSAQQAIDDYNDWWQLNQKTILDETLLPIEPFMTESAIAIVPAEIKAKSSAIANLSSLQTIPGVMVLTTKGQKIVSGDKVTIYTEKPVTFSQEGFDVISSLNKTVEYAFNIGEHVYKITIPAGAKVDFGDNLYQGPLYIGSQLGTVEIVK